jgi:hypothetical protein
MPKCVPNDLDQLGSVGFHRWGYQYDRQSPDFRHYRHGIRLVRKLVSGVVPLSHKYGLNLDPSTFAHEAETGYAAGVAAVPPWVAPDVILRDSMTTLLAAHGTPSAAEVDDFFALWRSLNPWEDVPSSQWALHKRFTLAILSNMSVATQSALMDRAGLPFDRTLSAETVEAYRPRKHSRHNP